MPLSILPHPRSPAVSLCILPHPSPPIPRCGGIYLARRLVGQTMFFGHNSHSVRSTMRRLNSNTQHNYVPEAGSRDIRRSANKFKEKGAKTAAVVAGAGTGTMRTGAAGLAICTMVLLPERRQPLAPELTSPTTGSSAELAETGGSSSS